MTSGLRVRELRTHDELLALAPTWRELQRQAGAGPFSSHDWALTWFEELEEGVALHSDKQGDAKRAYVLNTVDSTVSIVDVSEPKAPVVITTFEVGDDPVPDEVRLVLAATSLVERPL